MNILLVGYTDLWKQRVMCALPREDDTTITIKGEFLATAFVQEEQPFDLYIFGNRLEKDHNVAVDLLQEAHDVGDKTPTIVFSEEFDDEARARILSLGATLIRSDERGADDTLLYVVKKKLGLT